MKKKRLRKLIFNKVTVTALDREDQRKVQGASLVDIYHCSDSCSLIIYCCKPTEEQICPPPPE